MQPSVCPRLHPSDDRRVVERIDTVVKLDAKIEVKEPAGGRLVASAPRTRRPTEEATVWFLLTGAG